MRAKKDSTARLSDHIAGASLLVSKLISATFMRS